MAARRCTNCRSKSPQPIFPAKIMYCKIEPFSKSVSFLFLRTRTEILLWPFPISLFLIETIKVHGRKNSAVFVLESFFFVLFFVTNKQRLFFRCTHFFGNISLLFFTEADLFDIKIKFRYLS